LTQIKSAARSLLTRTAATAPPCAGRPYVAPPSSSPMPVLPARLLPPPTPRRHHTQRGQLIPKACRRSPPSAPHDHSSRPFATRHQSSLCQSSLIQPHIGAALEAGSSVPHRATAPPALRSTVPDVAISTTTSLLHASVLPHPGLRQCRWRAQCGQLIHALRCRSSHLQARASGRGSQSF
jgi:hypothetical protein